MSETNVIEKPTRLGLLERIKAATSVEELDALLEEGKTFAQAHPSTRARWGRAAKVKRAKLGADSK